MDKVNQKIQNLMISDIEEFIKIRKSWENFSRRREFIPKSEKTMICKRCKSPK